MEENEIPPSIHAHTHTDGSVLSNPDTITALRQGVDVTVRCCAIEIEDGTKLPVALVEDSEGSRVVLMEDVLEEEERRRLGPRRREGIVKLGSLDSLAAYVDRFRLDTTVAFAPRNPPGVTVVFDYHEPTDGAPGWCGDRAHYDCPLSRQWNLWTAAEGRPFTQVQFGELLDQNQRDLRGDDQQGLASAARMIEVAMNLVVHSGSKYERKINPTTGEGTLISSTEHDTNSTKIPRAFGLWIPVFEGSDAHYLVECALRFSMIDGKVPQFAFVMLNKADVYDQALTGVRHHVAEACRVPVFEGTAPPVA